MKQSGRVSMLMLASLVSVLVVCFILLFSRASLQSYGVRFMDALQRHDVDTLTKMSMMSGTSEADIRKEWDRAVNVTGRYYLFFFKVEGADEASPTTGTVRVDIVKDADKPGSYDEHVQLPMVKVGDDWKVDVRGMSHELFPGLPR